MKSGQLIIVYGPGGVGRTTFALRLGATLSARYQRGLLLADLQDLARDGQARNRSQEIGYGASVSNHEPFRPTQNHEVDYYASNWHGEEFL